MAECDDQLQSDPFCIRIGGRHCCRGLGGQRGSHTGFEIDMNYIIIAMLHGMTPSALCLCLQLNVSVILHIRGICRTQVFPLRSVSHTCQMDANPGLIRPGWPRSDCGQNHHVYIFGEFLAASISQPMSLQISCTNQSGTDCSGIPEQV